MLEEVELVAMHRDRHVARAPNLKGQRNGGSRSGSGCRRNKGMNVVVICKQKTDDVTLHHRTSEVGRVATQQPPGEDVVSRRVRCEDVSKSECSTGW